METQPSISLCMIVKNEQHYLPDCLASARPYVDEIVVIDTGSTDNTIEIARSFGANVYHFEWINDFAAARNESLRHATGDWVLQLDADERLNLPDSPQALRDAVSAPGVDAYAVSIQNLQEAVGKPTHSVNYNYRLFRRLPEIRFEREVHESIEQSLIRTQSSTAYAEFVIEHIGYAVNSEAITKKLERNLDILQNHIQRHGENAYILYYLGNTYRVLGRTEECLAVFQRALDSKDINNTLIALIYNSMNIIYLGLKNYEKTITTAKKSLEVMPLQNTARYFLGAAHYNLKEYKEALPYLVSCYQYWRLPTGKKTTGISQEYTMSEQELLRAITFCHFSLNNYSQAIIFGRRFLDFDNQNIEVLHIISLSYFNLNQFSLSINLFIQALKSGLSRDLICHNIAYAYFKINDFKQFECELNSINETDPGMILKSIELLILLANTSNDNQLLLELFEDKKYLFMQCPFEQLGRITSSLAQNGRFDVLEVVFDSLHQRVPELEALLKGVIDHAAAQGCLHDLLLSIEKLAAKHTSHSVILHALGIICIKLGKFCRAIDIYTSLHKLNPDNGTLSRTLAGLHVSIGNMEQALQLLAGTKENQTLRLPQM
jgi:glycosyltransferase involved in cell wall biosynthesis